MFTIRIKTKSTKQFSWSISGVRGLCTHTAPGLREAVMAAIAIFRDYVEDDAQAQDGVQACLLTWEDGDDLYAFIFPKDGEVPTDLPWTLMRTQPERVTR